MTLGPTPRSKIAIREALLHYFNNGGYVRWQNLERLETESYKKFKKGHECRFVASSMAEVRQIRTLLRRAGFRYGRPYKKGNQIVLPLYGCLQVIEFLSFIGRHDLRPPNTADKTMPPNQPATAEG